MLPGARADGPGAVHRSRPETNHAADDYEREHAVSEAVADSFPDPKTTIPGPVAGRSGAAGTDRGGTPFHQHRWQRHGRRPAPPAAPVVAIDRRVDGCEHVWITCYHYRRSVRGRRRRRPRSGQHGRCGRRAASADGSPLRRTPVLRGRRQDIRHQGRKGHRTDNSPPGRRDQRSLGAGAIGQGGSAGGARVVEETSGQRKKRRRQERHSRTLRRFAHVETHQQGHDRGCQRSQSAAVSSVSPPLVAVHRSWKRKGEGGITGTEENRSIVQGQ
mmetsp:Transcript_1864/g.3995  ORF Transcript_1864/g.3995 Transcript_1864/m.3995 type:complete len:273 (+) Transcript_1864:877-1695(+)